MSGRRWLTGALLALVGAAAVLLLSACQPQLVLRLVVTTTTDGHDAAPGNGVCEMTAGAGNCSLRAAFEEASVATVRSDVTVPGGTYVLSTPGPESDPEASDPLIVGGDHPIGVHADGAVVQGDARAVIRVATGEVGITGLSTTGGERGYQVMSSASMVLFGAHVSQIVGPGISAEAGAHVALSYVAVDHAWPAITSSGDLSLDHVSLHDDVGGIELAAGRATVVDSTITNNHGQATGGGISAGNVFGTTDIDVVVRRSTIDHNAATGQIGGIFLQRGTLTIEQSTIEANAGEDVSVGYDYGGGLKASGRVTISGSTFHDDDAGAATGLVHLVAGTMAIGGSVLDDPGPACTGAIASTGYNVDRSGTCGFASTGDRSGIDPGLSSFGFHGGSSRTRLPSVGSPLTDAIPAGTAGLCDTGTPTDQRGVARPSGATCDIGSVEGTDALPIDPLHLVVDSAIDGPDTQPGDGVCETLLGGCTLRAAIDETNAFPGPDQITFAAGVDSVITSTGTAEDLDATGDLDVLDQLTIDGGGATLDAGLLDRAIDVRAGGLVVRDLTITRGQAGFEEGGAIREVGVAAAPALTLDGVTLTGNQGFSGGALYVRDSAVVSDSTLSANRAVAGGALSTDGASGASLTITGSHLDDNQASSGGAISSVAGTASLTITDSRIIGNTTSSPSAGGGGVITAAQALIQGTTIEANVAAGGGSGCSGGGIFVVGGSLTLDRSAVVGNRSCGQGGGVAVVLGSASILSSTIDGNQATHFGGGVWSSVSPPTAVRSSTITANSAADGAGLFGSISIGGVAIENPGTNCDGSISSVGSSVASDASCNLTATGDRPSTAPGLGPLGANGGLTASRLPLAGSPLVDAVPIGTAGLCDGTLAEDQRGVSRPQGPACDIGAVER